MRLPHVESSSRGVGRRGIDPDENGGSVWFEIDRTMACPDASRYRVASRDPSAAELVERAHRMSEHEPHVVEGVGDEPAEPPFTYHRDDAGRIVVVGDVDMASAAAFRPVLLASTDPIELDLSSVAFMDSSGVKVLLQARKVRPVRIAAASPAVARVLELFGLSETFDL